MPRRSLIIAPVVSLLLLVAAACGGSSGGSPATDESAGAKLSGTVTVFAASSLTGAFTELGHRFERDNPGVHVRFSFSGSDTLAAQIISGAPADIFAAASPTTMGLVTAKSLTAGTPTPFVRNRLEIAVKPGNPHHLESLADLTKPGIKLAVCEKTVPCGSAAASAFATAKLTPHPVTYEVDVKSVLTKVVLGEVDAGLVYKTDVQSAGDKVDGVPFPEAGGAINTYPIAILKDAPNSTAAQAFERLVLSSDGRSVLEAAGFLPPS